MVKVSVIIPVYNVVDYLPRCIDSVINQTLKDIEIIIVDDGSTDGSADVIRRYVEKDKRIIPIFKENGRQSTARNAGLHGEFCRSGFFGYLHAVYALKKYPSAATAIYCRALFFFS